MVYVKNELKVLFLKNNISVSFYFLTLLYFQSIIVAFLAIYLNSDTFVLIDINTLSVATLLIFTIIILAIIKNQNLYFFFLPIVLIAFPNVVNDLFPSYYMGSKDELNAATFSIITHIDIYLLFGIILFKRYKLNNADLIPSFGSFILIMLTYYTLNLLITTHEWTDLYLLCSGNYIIRYSLLIILLVSVVRITDNVKKYIIFGIGTSVFVLLLESSLFTYLRESDRLSSGTLGVNVYGNVIAAITLFFIFMPETFKIKRIFRGLVIVTGVIIVILTKTKMSLLSLLLVFFIVLMIILFKQRRAKYFVFFAITSIVILFATTFYIIYDERFFNLIKSLSLHGIELNHYTSSIFTRLLLFKTSINMIIENPILGIGVGRWDFYKNDYGFPLKVLIDSHNDYLSYLSMFGIFAGSYLIFQLLFFPSYYFLKERIRASTHSYIWGIIPFTLIFAGLTNSNTLKHQVFAFVFLIYALIRMEKSKEYKK